MKRLGLSLVLVLFTACSQQTTPPAVEVTLTLSVEGKGGGTVVSSPPGLSCSDACQASYEIGTAVKLSATPRDDSYFIGFSGDCSGQTCTLFMDGDKTVVAIFDLIPPSFDPTGYYQGYTTQGEDAQQRPAVVTITELSNPDAEAQWQAEFDLGDATFVATCFHDFEEARFVCGTDEGSSTLVYGGAWNEGVWSGSWSRTDEMGMPMATGTFRFERQSGP